MKATLQRKPWYGPRVSERKKWVAFKKPRLRNDGDRQRKCGSINALQYFSIRYSEEKVFDFGRRTAVSDAGLTALEGRLH
jgi:hypothetical protein